MKVVTPVMLGVMWSGMYGAMTGVEGVGNGYVFTVP